MAVRDARVLAVMRDLVGQYPRCGDRKMQIFLRQGPVMSADRGFCLWRHAGLQVSKRRPRRRVATSHPRPSHRRRSITCGVRLCL